MDWDVLKTYTKSWKEKERERLERERGWKEELEKYGKEKASVTRTIIRMIRRRLLIAALLTILFAVLSILGQVRTTLVSPHLVSVLF